MSQNSSITRYTAGLFITPVSSLFAKVGYEYWDAKDFSSLHTVHVGVGGSF